MITTWPTVTFETFLKQRKEFITIRDDRMYKRVTVQFYARGIKERDAVLGNRIKTKQQQIIRAGDLLVAEIDAKEGGFGIVPIALDGAIVSSHYFIYEIDTTKIDPYYLEYYLRSGQPTEEVQKYVRGSTNYAGIRGYHFLQLTIPLPSVEEQQRIVAMLDAFSLRFEEAKDILVKLHVESEFVTSSSISKLIRNHKSIYIQKKLGDIIEAIGGGTPSKKNARYWNGDIPWVTPKDMKTFVITDSQDRITELALRESSAKIVPQESVLIVLRSNILARTVPIAVTTVPVTINQDMRALIPSDDIDAHYLALVLRALERDLLSCVKLSVTMRSIPFNDLSDITIPVPPIEIQRQSVAWEKNRREQQEEFLVELKEFDEIISALYTSVLARALSQDLHVSIPEHLMNFIQMQKLVERERQLQLLQSNQTISSNDEVLHVQQEVHMKMSRDLTHLLRQLTNRGEKRVTAVELWHSLGSSDRDINLFYAFLKTEYLENRIIERRENNIIYLEVVDET